MRGSQRSLSIHSLFPVLRSKNWSRLFAAIRDGATALRSAAARRRADGPNGLKIGPGDAVFVPDFTFCHQGGGEPAGRGAGLCDVLAETFNLDPEVPAGPSMPG